MTTMTKDRPTITRPGSGVAVDPRRVMTMRMIRDLTREQVSEGIEALAMTDEHGRAVSLKKDAVGKIETGQRKPSQAAFRALCAVLSCTTLELMPGGGPAPAMPASAKVRQTRLDHNRELRKFAIFHGLRYKNPRTGRIYYKKALRDAFAAQVAAEVAAGSGDPAAIEDAQLAAARALDHAIRTLGLPSQEDPGVRKAS